MDHDRQVLRTDMVLYVFVLELDQRDLRLGLITYKTNRIFFIHFNLTNKMRYVVIIHEFPF